MNVRAKKPTYTKSTLPSKTNKNKNTNKNVINKKTPLSNSKTTLSSNQDDSKTISNGANTKKVTMSFIV